MDFTTKVVIVVWKCVTFPSKQRFGLTMTMTMFDYGDIRETVWKVVNARIEWCEWQIESAGGVTIVQTDPVPVTSIVTLCRMFFSVTADAIDRYEQCRRLWLCRQCSWSVTDRVRGRVTSLPWSPARAAGSKVFPNLQTILFSTNKPKISTTFKVFFHFHVWRRRENCVQAWWEYFSRGTSELSYLQLRLVTNEGKKVVKGERGK